ncbi:MAG: acetyl-CoA carboxylase biotin carboxyl carrier protein [Eubacteriales bacterium]
MNVNDILKLIDKVDNSSIHELQIHDDKFQLMVSKNNIDHSSMQYKVSHTIEHTDEPVDEIKSISTPMTSEDSSSSGKVIHSPLVGIYYDSSSPSAKPFLKVGDIVNEGDVVCIIEAMKVFNEIKSPFSGVVKKILVSNEEIVEYDQQLIIIGDNA